MIKNVVIPACLGWLFISGALVVKGIVTERIHQFVKGKCH